MSTTSSDSPGRRDLLILGLAGLLVYGIAGGLIRSPGYMDAEYYLVTGGELAAGHGFQEPLVWNYLDDPQGVPHPSHTYWMPVASLAAGLGQLVFGGGFRAGQIPFLLAAALFPLLCFIIAWSTTRERHKARLAGILGLLPGLFFPFMLTTDTFAIYALVGGGGLVAVSSFGSGGRWPVAVGAGALVGLAHLTRADGVLLWIPMLAAIAAREKRRTAWAAGALLGYGLVLTPWIVRNMMDTGSLWPQGTGRALWLLGYDETFSYPANLLTAPRWWSGGVLRLAVDRVSAAATNLRSLLLVNGLVFMAPLMIAGVWRRRAAPLVRSMTVYLLALFAAMSFVFPYAGARGGFFHSSAAIQPILLALVPDGLEAFIAWVKKSRPWDSARAYGLFSAALMVLSLTFTAWATWSRLTGDGRNAGWERNVRTYTQMTAALPAPHGLVAVNNPPGLFAASGLSGVVIPNGTPDTLRLVVERYEVSWVLLEANHPKGLDQLFASAAGNDFLESPLRLADADGHPMYLFRVKP
ncbi:MAG TPA: hypothetical protein VFI11_08280 [Anaerolineales bacterium]|nr:hypothetical protein [Anaerolineales bacterium]